jgi:hypothetical protein
MDEQTQTILEIERAKGDEAKRVWDSFIEPVFGEKEELLFEAFKATPVRDQEALTLIHLQYKALESVKQHFAEAINTGQMASMQLELEEVKKDG